VRYVSAVFPEKRQRWYRSGILDLAGDSGHGRVELGEDHAVPRLAVCPCLGSVLQGDGAHRGAGPGGGRAE
jgi:hypothetical protein